jgi:hypothetical protein
MATLTYKGAAMKTTWAWTHLHLVEEEVVVEPFPVVMEEGIVNPPLVVVVEEGVLDPSSMVVVVKEDSLYPPSMVEEGSSCKLGARNGQY